MRMRTLLVVVEVAGVVLGLVAHVRCVVRKAGRDALGTHLVEGYAAAVLLAGALTLVLIALLNRKDISPVSRSRTPSVRSPRGTPTDESLSKLHLPSEGAREGCWVTRVEVFRKFTPA